MTITVATTTTLMKVFYPNGIVAYAPVFPDGTYYGKDDVDAGRAVAELSWDCPLDKYHEWYAHTPTPILERIESTFATLLRILGAAGAGRVIQAISTSEVYTHFRRWEDM